jgi:hypothetical protein
MGGLSEYHDGNSNVLQYDGQIKIDNPANSYNLQVKNDGTGDGIFIDQNGNAISLNIDSEATSQPAISYDSEVGNTGQSLRFKHGGTTKVALERIDALNNDCSLQLGGIYLWFDISGCLRASNSRPSHDFSGSKIGLQDNTTNGIAT